jgi:ribonucleotide reductase alpha subunit
VRRIGLGIMGLADVMYKIGVRYGDQESQDLAGQVMEFVRYHCMRTSIELARERGPFPPSAAASTTRRTSSGSRPRPAALQPRLRPARGGLERIVEGIKRTASATARRPPWRPPAPSAPSPAARATAASRSSRWPTPDVKPSRLSSTTQHQQDDQLPARGHRG